MSQQTQTPFSTEAGMMFPGFAEKAVLTIAEVATILRCSKANVSNVLNGRVAGVSKLTHFAMGRRKLVRKEWLADWMEENKDRC